MSAESPSTEHDVDLETDDSIAAAYEAVGEALQELAIGEHTQQYSKLQQRYFDLRAAMLARDTAFQTISLDGTNLYVPTSRRPSGNPVVDDIHGEIKFPTRIGNFRVLDSIEVSDANNPHVTHHVSVDHVIDTDGDVSVEVNAETLDKLL